MSKKKIFYIITKSNFGGAQRYVYDIATSLPKERYEPTVIYGGKGLLGEKLQSAGVRTIAISHLERDIRLGGELKTLWTLFQLFQSEKPDIIHLNSSKIGGLGSLAGRIARVPRIIFTAHGWHFKEERPRTIRITSRFLSWLTALFSHAVITVSDDDKRCAPKFLVSQKIVRIHNGLSAAKRPLSRSAARRKLRQLSSSAVESLRPDSGKAAIGTRGALWVGTISELHANKGLTYAIEAVARATALGKKVVFFIIGEGENRAALAELAARLNIEDRVHFLGFVDNAPSLLSACDVFTLTSTKEGFPYAILEAGCAGCATIGSAVGGIPEIITDMETGILTRPKETDEITKALLFLAENGGRRAKLGAALRARVTEYFTKSRMLRDTLSLYQ